MTIRTTRTTVTFKRPFVLAGIDEEQPAGVYDIEMDEERLEGLSFPAYRRVLTLIHLHPKTSNPGLTQSMRIDPDELKAALQRDQASEGIPVGLDVCRRPPRRIEEARWEDADREAIERGENEGMLVR